MKISKSARKLAKELELSIYDAIIMELKSRLYIIASDEIKASTLSHEGIAELVGTSRTRITRIANMGENSVSIEILLKIILATKNELPMEFKEVA